jgi:hypothetical protein
LPDPLQKWVVNQPAGTNKPGALPKNWIGQQAFTIGVADKANSSQKQEWILVPFADASQAGGAMKVWLPLEVKN